VFKIRKTCEDRRIKALKTVKTQSILLVLSQKTCKKVGQVKKRFPAWKTIVNSIKFDQYKHWCNIYTEQLTKLIESAANW
jgi:hypothetical protein